MEEKNLFDFFGIPLIIYQLKRYSFFLKQKSIRPSFIVVANESNYGTIKNKLKDFPVKEHSLVMQKLPDQSGAILSALEEADLTGPLLVVNGNDIITEKVLYDLLKKTEGNDIVLSAAKVESYIPGGYLVLGQSKDKVERIWEKPPAEEVPRHIDLFRFVLDYFKDAEGLKTALTRNPDEVVGYEDAINSMLKDNRAGYVLNFDKFASLKYPWHILEAMEIFLNNIKDSVVKTEDIDPSARIVGKVYIEEGVKIGSFAKISGPCYIGRNTVIGDHVLVRDSHIASDCIVGAHSEVARSYLGHKVLLHRNYVGDSVLDRECSLGANTVTANWRFDQEPVKSMVGQTPTDTKRTKLGAIIGRQARIGVGVNIMPGVKIEKKSLVMPGTTVYKDLTNHDRK